MKSLLIIAHGSRREGSNQEIIALRNKIAASSPQFDLIGHAFLELAKPNIVDGATELINKGATEVLIIPYFLVAGQHVVADIPEEIAKLQRLHPDISFSVAPYFGSSDGVVSELLSQVQNFQGQTL